MSTKPIGETITITYTEVLERATRVTSALTAIISTEAVNMPEQRRQLLRDATALLVARNDLVTQLEALGVSRKETIDFTGQLAMATLQKTEKPVITH